MPSRAPERNQHRGRILQPQDIQGSWVLSPLSPSNLYCSWMETVLRIGHTLLSAGPLDQRRWRPPPRRRSCNLAEGAINSGQMGHLHACRPTILPSGRQPAVPSTRWHTPAPRRTACDGLLASPIFGARRASCSLQGQQNHARNASIDEKHAASRRDVAPSHATRTKCKAHKFRRMHQQPHSRSHL